MINMTRLDANPHTYGDAIRMAGHLLEHHPGTGKPYYTENGKACYCVWGALTHSFRALGLDDNGYLPDGILQQVGYLAFGPKAMSFVGPWEGLGTTPATRLVAAKRLQSYSEP